MEQARKPRHGGHINYDKWGYIFLIPFFVCFFVFQFVPLVETFVYSFQEYYDDGLDVVGPTWSGWANYQYIFTYGADQAGSFILFNHVYENVYMPNFLSMLINTLLIWIIGFVPQIIVSLLLAVWFTDSRLKVRGQRFWKTIIYMPNLIMASAFGMLFLMIFAQNGPVIQILVDWGWIDGANRPNLQNDEMWTHIIIAGLNFLMWFGNTTLLLLSGVMGIDQSLFESARVDGASPRKIFWSITMPLLKPIFLYVFITSMIGGIQLFDLAQIYTQGTGGLNQSSMTLMMYLYNLVTVKHNYGQAGALSVILFVITALLSFAVYATQYQPKSEDKFEAKARKKRLHEYRDCPLTQQEIVRREAR